MKSLFLVLFGLLCLAHVQTHANELYAIQDNAYTGLPNNFRTMQDRLPSKPINTEGLKDLYVSASAQYSEEGFHKILEILPTNGKIIFFDLREESHGFINGLHVSWRYDGDNGANIGKSLQEIEIDEKFRLDLALTVGAIELKKQKKIPAQNLVVVSAKTERELVESLGHTYIRLPITDNLWPSDEVVDMFVKTISAMPKEAWKHGHCKEGGPRATTFLVLYDIMNNAQKVSLDDILKRQRALGGSDLANLNPFRKRYASSQMRLNFIRNFYEYCLEVPDYSVSWSEWINRNEAPEIIGEPLLEEAA